MDINKLTLCIAELYGAECLRYAVNYKKIPVLPYLSDNFCQENLRIMNIGLNAYLNLRTISKEGSEHVFSSRWSKWARNVKNKHNGGDGGSQRFHRYVAGQTKVLRACFGQTMGEYWTNFIKIYLTDIEGKTEHDLLVQ